jgi:Zn-dependent peptidase ImmA (M78 family)
VAGHSTHRSPSARQGIRAARAARADLGLTLEEPLDDVLEAVERLAPPVAVLNLPESVAGAYLCRPGGRVVFVNRVHAVQRQRFTLAHELGHHRLDHPANTFDQPQDLADFSRDPVEVQANWFAAEFLMPLVATRRWVSAHVHEPAHLEHVVRFACDFGISAKAACIRLQTAGSVPDEARGRQLHAEIARNEHLHLAELLGLGFRDDALAAIKDEGPRIPPALAGGALARYAAGQLDERAVATTVGRSPAEIRAFALDAGLPLGA